MDKISIYQRVRVFLEENFFIDFEETEADENLLEAGYIDSMGFVRLVTFLEESFEFEIPTDDLLNDSLSSLEHMCDYIKIKTQA
jgi:D-alanine--poly(phosphoribitol) ligase subunit 2